LTTKYTKGGGVVGDDSGGVFVWFVWFVFFVVRVSRKVSGFRSQVLGRREVGGSDLVDPVNSVKTSRFGLHCEPIKVSGIFENSIACLFIFWLDI